MKTFLCIILVILTSGIAAFEYWKSKKMYQNIDRMLDEVLNQEPVSQSDVREGKISALAGKAKRIQEKLELEVDRAEQEKEQVKGLISNMSHQLKTPLAAIMMYEEILEHETLTGEQYQKYLERIRLQSEKLDWILQSLFKMVKLEQNVICFEAEYILLRETILNAVNAVYEKAEKKRIEIIIEPFADCKIYHNRKWTAEVFVNLLENAIKYTGEGGSIHVKITPFEMYTQIAFEDNGIGIPEDEQLKIFKRFYRSREVENMEGSGIGLYLSKLIVEKEKGYLNVSSVYGQGSRFSVFLQNCKN